MKLPVKPWLDQVGRFPVTHFGGIPHFNIPVELDAPRTGILHTTEGGWEGSFAIFKTHFAPHFMLGWDNTIRSVRVAQLVQIGTIGAAMKAHNSKAIVQIEMIGFSKETPWLPEAETAEALASLMAECRKQYGIPLTHAWPDGDFGKAGNNPHRTSGHFGKEAGWFGHGDCPNPDSHWDPGSLRWSAIFEQAEEILLGFPPADALAGPAAMADA